MGGETVLLINKNEYLTKIGKTGNENILEKNTQWPKKLCEVLQISYISFMKLNVQINYNK